MSKFTARRENGHRRPRGYAAWRPQAKTRALLDCVVEILDEYEDYLPLTVRQIFYRLVGAYSYEKTENSYGRLSEALVRARRARLIPFEHLRDDGVVVSSETWYESEQGFHEENARRVQDYRRDRQQGQTYRLELWSEAGGMLPQLARVAHEFSIPVYSSGGFLSVTGVRSIVDRARLRDTPTVVLHVGDFDPSGESIFEALAADAQAFLQEDRLLASQEIIPVRVALTAAQVEEYALATAPTKATDTRSKTWAGETCQLEALAPDKLAKILWDAILMWIDVDTLAEQVAFEDQDRASLQRALPRGGPA